MSKVAIVVPDFEHGGGVPVVAQFIHHILSDSQRYTPHIISTATSSGDQNSVHLFAPRSWQHGIQTTEHVWRELPVQHIGAFLTEFEFQRYMPRKRLTELLNQFDLIQVVAGTPALAKAAKDISKPVCLFTATLARLERKSVMQNALFPHRVYKRMILPIISEVEKQALHQVDHVFAESEYTRQAILPYVDATKVSIDTVGVDIHRFLPIPSELRDNDYILSVGRFADPRKNVTLLFDAYAWLRHHMPDAPKLVLAGKTGPTEIAWSRAEKLGITEHIVIIKDASLDELITLYQHAAFFVLSSDEEGLGIVLLEAMACATPVISTRCGGPDSVVSETVGFLTPVGDSDALSDRMLWMLQNPDKRRKMGYAGRQMIEARFSNEVVGRKYLDVYDKLLGVQ